MDYKESVKNIREELSTYIRKNRIQTLVLGISGGIDSTLCALLARPVCDELGILLIGRSLPATSNSTGENARAISMGSLFCTNFKEVSIEEEFLSIYKLACNNFAEFVEEGNQNDILKGNIKARLRMILLYDIAGASSGMVLSTDNYTEYLLGFWTLHGDVGDYGMIQGLWKTEVYEMAEWIRNNEYSPVSERGLAIKSCIDADATDGLGISKTDLDQIMPGWIGSSKDGYKEVDERLALYTRFGRGDLDDPVIQRSIATHFKRDNPVNIPRERITKN